MSGTFGSSYIPMGTHSQNAGQLNGPGNAPGNNKLTISNDSSSPLAGLSKHQLYEIMSRMKVLIEQNAQQARKILVDNPALTKGLFQAQILLGMVRPPKVVPSIQQPASQVSQNPVQSSQQGGHVQTRQSATVAQASSVQNFAASRPPAQLQTGQHSQMPATTQSQPQNVSLQQSLQRPQSIPQPIQIQHAHSQAHLPSQSMQQSASQSRSTTMHHHLAPPAPQNIPMQPVFPAHSQQPLPQPAATARHQPVPPPLPQHPRPSSMQQLPQQLQNQPVQSMGFQPSLGPQQHQPQAKFMPHALLPLPNQPPPQQMYQINTGPGGSAAPVSHSGSDTSIQGMGQGNIGMQGPGLQAGRGHNLGTGMGNIAPPVSWPPAPPETAPNFVGGAPPLAGSNMVRAQVPNEIPNQAPQSMQLQHQVSEQEKGLMEQVMNLTPEQINALPAEFRSQIIDLQQRFRGTSL